MIIHYPEIYNTGDIVFTCIGSTLFKQVSAASSCWSNHVGVIIGHNGEDYIVAESRIPLSTTTTLQRFIDRSSQRRYAVRRVSGGLSDEQQAALTAQVPGRLHRLYHTGFDYNSSRQFCSKFVFDIYKEGPGISVGRVKTFKALLENNPGAKLGFWTLWFLGNIPWERETVTPESLWSHPGLDLIYNSHAL